jgi:hypothetical protein
MRLIGDAWPCLSQLGGLFRRGNVGVNGLGGELGGLGGR